MGLFALARERRRLARLRRQLQESPRPFGLAELARAYLALGETVSARDVVERGRSLFPDSMEIQRVHALVQRVSSDDRLAAAKQKALDAPSPQALLELADVYRGLGQPEQCAGVLAELIDRFGENATAIAQLGELKYRRYLDSLAPSDGVQADQFLRRAIERASQALRPRYLLAEFCLRIGAFERSAALAVELLDMSRDHERAKVVRDLADARRHEDKFTRENLEAYLSDVESRMEFAGPRLPWDGGHDGAEPGAERKPVTEPNTEVWRVKNATRAKAALLLDASGGMHGAQDGDDLRRVLPALAAMCDRASRRMEIGPPARLFVESDDATLVIALRRGTAFGVVVERERGADAERAIAAAEDALECVLGGA